MTSTRLLVVEDEIIIARELEAMLNGLGYIVTGLAATAQEALEAVAAGHPDLVLMDIMLKGEKTGIQAAIEISQRFGLPIIFVTAYGDDETLLQAKLAEPVGYIIKPFNQSALRVSIEVGLYKKHQFETRLYAAEAFVRQSETRFRSLTENGADLIILLGADARVHYVSPNVQHILGYSESEFIPLVTELVHVDDRESYERRMAEILQHPDETIMAEYRIQHKDGSWRWFEATIRNLLSDSNVSAIVFNGRDITARKRADSTLLSQGTALSVVANAIAITNLDGTIEWVNPAFSLLTGYTLEEALGKNSRQLIKSGLHDQAFYKHMWDTLIAGNVWQGELTNRRKDGSLYDEEQTITPFKNAEGKVTGFIAIKQDVTARKRTEAARKTSELGYRRLFEATKDGILIIDADSGVITDVNPSIIEILGYSHTEFLKKQLWEIGLFKDIVANQDAFRQLHEERYVRYENLPLQTKGGERIFVEFVSNAYDVDEKPFVQCNIREITARAQVEQALAEHTAELASLYRATNSLLHSMGDVTRLAEEIAVAMTQEFELADCGVMLVDQAETELIRVARAGNYRVAKGPNLILTGPGLSVVAFRSGETVYAPDVQTAPGYIRSDSRTRSELALPLRVGSQVIGVMDMQSPEPNAFDDRARRIVAAYAERAALALQTAQLHERTEQQVQHLTALRAINTAITASLDLGLTLRVFLEQVTDRLAVDAADVLLLSSSTRILEYAAGRGFRSMATQHAHLRLGQGYAGRAALQRELISLPDMSAGDPGFVARPSLWAGEGFRAYYATPLVVKGIVKGVLEVFHRAPHRAQPDWLEFLEALAGQAAIAIDNANLFTELQSVNMQLFMAYDATIEGWSRALDLRDQETEGHTQRVAEMTVTLARAMGLQDAELVHIRRGGLLHDIGKMGVPDGILHKPGPLTDEEWVLMRKHPQYAYDWLAPITYLQKSLDIPYCHYEKWDGSGYPRGLKGEAIPMAARLFAIVDVWDALRSDRPYRLAWPEQKVIDHLRSAAGSHFDPKVVDLFLQIINRRDGMQE